MTKEERLKWLKRIEQDIYVSSLESTFADDMKSCAIHSVIEELEQGPETIHFILLDECANSGYYCSKCHKKVVKEGWSDTVKKIKYCPNCGGKVQEVKNEMNREQESFMNKPCVSVGVWGKKALMEMPSVTPATKWIPVDERLPEEHICDDGFIEPSESVLVQLNNKDMKVSRYWGSRESYKDKPWIDLSYPTTLEVVAWQPLPKSYKENGE